MKYLKLCLKETVPKRRNVSKNPVPWWTKECTEKIKERNRMCNKMSRKITFEKVDEYLKKKAEAQRVLRQAERNYWRTFCMKLDRYMPESKIWTCIKRMNGVLITKTKNMSTLIVNSKDIVSDPEKANAFGNYFQKIGIKDRDTNKELPKAPNNDIHILNVDHVINEPFFITEFEKAVQSRKRTAPGKDNIPYFVYENLPKAIKEIMLNIINLIWKTGEIPLQLKHSVIIPILKHGKDPRYTSSYRPIALTSCFAKIIERIIKERLQWFFEKHELLPNFLSGFRKGRSVTDNIVQLENDIQKSINCNEHVIAVFLDVEKAFDTVWIKGLVFKLAKYGIEGNMLRYIENYLTARTFQVRIGNTTSKTYKTHNGLPQGSVLSPLLYNIMMGDIPTDQDVRISMYADDCAIWISGRNIVHITEKIQKYLNLLIGWFEEWGFRLSPVKTVPVFFTKSWKDVLPPDIGLNGNVLMYEKSHRFLGVIFDKRLTWQPHIENVITRSKRKLNILKMSNWDKLGKLLEITYYGVQSTYKVSF